MIVTPGPATVPDLSPPQDRDLFAKLRYDRCAPTSFSAICIAAGVIFWL